MRLFDRYDEIRPTIHCSAQSIDISDLIMIRMNKLFLFIYIRGLHYIINDLPKTTALLPMNNDDNYPWILIQTELSSGRINIQLIRSLVS